MKISLQSRRTFLKSASVVSAGFLTMHRASGVLSAAQHLPVSSLYGPLRKDPAKVLDLPRGFEYQVISRMGQRMSDGLVTPGNHDGMAVLPGRRGRMILICNHESNPDQGLASPFGIQNELLGKVDKEDFYDYGFGEQPGLGGTTTLVYNPKTRKVEREFLSLAGTHRNCAGGPTPWNSWVTCEETVRLAGDGIEKDHGYNFEVPATDRPKLAKPIPLKDMGRFNHEASAVDPKSGVVYQTEDRGDGLIYRFIPKVPGKLAQGGATSGPRGKGLAQQRYPKLAGSFYRRV